MTIFDRIRRDERGQVLPLVVLMAVVLIGFAGLAIDMGRVWETKQQLQRTVDASALAAGQNLPNASNSYSAAVTYGGTGTANPIGGWGVTTASPTVTFECASNGPHYTSGTTSSCFTDTSGDNCHPSGSVAPASTTCNAVKITESATIKTGLLSLFIPSFTVSASSTAAARGVGIPNPVNAFVILDTTNSMGDSCSAAVTGISSPDKLDCAKAGVRAMLQAMLPCGTSLALCGNDVSGTTNVANPVDEVGELVFPAIAETMGSSSPYTLTGPSSTYLGYETDCSSSQTFPDTYPPYTAYTYNSGANYGGIPTTGPTADHDAAGDSYPGYEAVPLSSDFRTSDTSGLNLSSKLVDSVDWGETGCTSFPGTDNYGLKQIGGQGSYLAGAITEAQYLLAAAPTRTGPNGQPVTNVIIVLSDGELNDPDKCSQTNQCPSSSNPYKDGVDPGASANVGWTSTTPCEDAMTAATQAKAAGTLVYSIAYDDSGNGDTCNDSGGGGWNGQAATFMQDLASNAQDFEDSSAGAGDLTASFSQVGTELSGDSQLIPDCTQAPPAC
jgi:Flp pilus assembly protein TadG